MCDESTLAEDAAWLTRRGFARASAGAAALAALPGCMATAGGRGGATDERMVGIATSDGVADAFFVHPRSGRHLGVVMWPDVASLRDAYKTMARRLAGEGYAVLVPNPYYRNARAPVVASMAEWRTPEGRARIEPMRAALTAEAVTRDATAFVGFLDGERPVDKNRQMGTMGYCMGGPFAIRTAAAAPARLGAAASFHGGGLVTEEPDSPHRLFPVLDAGLLIAIAENDDARAPGEKTVLRSAADAAGRSAEIEVYPAQHGWCTIDSPVYETAQAERAWGRMLALFSGL